MKIFKWIGSFFDFMLKYFKVIVLLLIIFLISGMINEPIKNPNLAKIYIKGAIMDSAPLREQIKNIKNYPSVKGVLLIINSGGGAVGASVEMADLIKELNEIMPVVVHTEGFMASGAYYAGMYASEIYANRGASIGSIGVILNGLNIQEALNKLGIKEQGLKAGEFKEIGTSMREWSENEREFLNQYIQETYMQFVSDVIKARKLKIPYKEFAEGKIFTAKQAKKLGLINDIASQNQAILRLKELSGVDKEIEWLEKSKFDSYIESLSENSASFLINTLNNLSILR